MTPLTSGTINHPAGRVTGIGDENLHGDGNASVATLHCQLGTEPGGGN